MWSQLASGGGECIVLGVALELPNSSGAFINPP